MYSGQHLVCNTAVSRPLPADMTIVTFLSEVPCVYCVFTQKNTHNIFEYAVYYAIIRIIIDILRMICYNIRRYRKRGERMGTTTIYRINETDRTINIAQSVNDTDESLHGAVLNTRMYTFDELMNQHKVFCEHTEPYDAFKDRLNSALRIDKSIEVSTDDMIARFIAEYGENIFFRGYVGSVIEFYDKERHVLLKPNDVVIAKLNRRKIQDEVSRKLMEFMDTQFALMCSDAYFGHKSTMEHFMIQSGRTIVAADDYTFNVFRESDNRLLTVLAEIGQLVHRNKWTDCECGFCHKLFLGTEGEVCCHSAECIEAQKQQKEKNIEENTQEYSAIKKDYDSFVRRYKGYLDVVEIDHFHPDDYDIFMQAKKERMDNMTSLKKKLIRNPISRLYLHVRHCSNIHNHYPRQHKSTFSNSTFPPDSSCSFFSASAPSRLVSPLSCQIALIYSISSCLTSFAVHDVLVLMS